MPAIDSALTSRMTCTGTQKPAVVDYFHPGSNSLEIISFSLLHGSQVLDDNLWRVCCSEIWRQTFQRDWSRTMAHVKRSGNIVGSLTRDSAVEWRKLDVSMSRLPGYSHQISGHPYATYPSTLSSLPASSKLSWIISIPNNAVTAIALIDTYKSKLVIIFTGFCCQPSVYETI